MKIKEVIGYVDDIKPNAFSEKTKMMWLSALEGRIAADVFLMDHDELVQLKYRYPEDLDTELLVEHPHDELYISYLQAKVDEANGEYEKYQNTMQVFNSLYNNFVCWFARTYDPAQGYHKIRLKEEGEGDGSV